VFVPCKPFQPSLMLAGKKGDYPSKAPEGCSTFVVVSWACTIKHYRIVMYGKWTNFIVS
jgi:hypothetical protein